MDEITIDQEKQKLIANYISNIRAQRIDTPGMDFSLQTALIYFLSAGDNSLPIAEQRLVQNRKLFILKILQENTKAGQFNINSIPSEIAKKLIDSYNQEKLKEENAKKEHINELLEEMQGLFS